MKMNFHSFSANSCCAMRDVKGLDINLYIHPHDHFLCNKQIFYCLAVALAGIGCARSMLFYYAIEVLDNLVCQTVISFNGLSTFKAC